MAVTFNTQLFITLPLLFYLENESYITSTNSITNLQFHEIPIYYFDHFILKKVLFLLLCFFVEGYLFLSIDLRSIKEATNVLPLTFS